LCASPLGLTYSWMNCDSTLLPDTTSCLPVSGAGCICVIIEHGGCIDTLCQDYNLCDLTCEIVAVDGICLGDSVIYTANGNYSATAILDWTIMLDNNTSFTFPNTDTIKLAYNATGCFSINLSVTDQGCTSFCNDTICVVDRPIADFCCDQVKCDSCVTISLWLSGTSPWTFAISDGNSIDTVSGVTSSQFDYVVCPPYNSIVYYQLLWIQDSLALCTGSIIHDSVLVYLEEKPEALIFVRGDTLYANPPGYAYSWTDCQNMSNFGINDYFVPTANGCYCVTVSTFLSDCRDSACVDFVLTDIHHPDASKDITTWYDPSDRSLYIQGFITEDPDYEIQLVDLQGRKVPYREVNWIDASVLKIELLTNTPSLIWVSLQTNRNFITRAIFIPVD
ncbi:MAG: hypothetical protein M3R25_11660, partial [Bacteroidota bacterium]|nr:hypothetical protein [Bacteroidota bacterium]